MGTNVPRITWTPTGPVAPSEAAIVLGVQQDINAAFGGTLNFGTSGGSPVNPTPQGQLATSATAVPEVAEAETSTSPAGRTSVNSSPGLSA